MSALEIDKQVIEAVGKIIEFGSECANAYNDLENRRIWRYPILVYTLLRIRDLRRLEKQDGISYGDQIDLLLSSVDKEHDE